MKALTVNGQVLAADDVPANETLLRFLRQRGLTGSKEGCAEGDCGACSVVVADRGPDGRPAWRAINSCIALVPSLIGREIRTVEGIGSPGALHPVQDAMVSHYGSQCGYCTPGFVASLFELYHRPDATEPGKIADQLCGNLCRCTGYRAIRDAACEALRRRTEVPPTPPAAAPDLAPMRHAAGGQLFLRPGSLDELFSLWAEHPTARLVGGATEIGVEITKHAREFPVLLTTEAVPELQTLRADADAWWIGGAVTLTRIEEAVAPEYPSLRQMLSLFASRQIRNRATLAGNLATASPIGDSAPVLLTLDASVVLRSAAETREVPLEAFFLDYRRTVLRAGELILAVRIPRTSNPPARVAFEKVSKRREMDISIVSGAFLLEVNDGIVRRARLAYGGVAATPRRVTAAEEALVGRTVDEATADVEQILAGTFAPLDDARGSAAYRSALVVSLWRKFAAGHATPEPDFLEQPPWPEPDASRSLPHDSAVGHVCGTARYVEDTALRRPMLEVWPVLAPHARARIRHLDLTAALAHPGVETILTAADIPGHNNVGPARHDEPALAEGEVFYHGQVVALVVGTDQLLCRRAADAVVVDYEPLEPILGIPAAIAAESWLTDPHQLQRGDAERALAAAPHRLSGTFSFGGQDHFYLETQAAWAEPTDDGGIFVASSTQHPSEIQTIVAEVLGLPRNQVVVEAPRMGGGFGGKETQGNLWAALVALAARRTGRPVRVQLDRDLDMTITGKRHPFRAEFAVGFDDAGNLLAAHVELVSDGGWSLDLSQPINDRALYHLDNAYYIPHVTFRGRVARTNVTSHTAFRGFGGPQGMLVIEEILARVARALGRPPEDVRRRNLYRGTGETNTTHYGQEVENNHLERLWDTLMAEADFAGRRREVDAWNTAHPERRRGLAITPVKFGISFTFTPYNQAGALVLVYRDGTVQVNHGGTEMGQGLPTKIAGVVMRAFGLPAAAIRTMPTRTDKVPNTSATAASSGSDLNGAAVADACRQILDRLAPVAAEALGAAIGRVVGPEEILWRDGTASVADHPDAAIPFSHLTERAYLARISLAASGFYRTPLIHWDWTIGRGRPFHYFALGAAVSEVEVDTATGAMEIRRVDILHDVGRSLNPAIDRGQIEGGFVQGVGWLTSEELLWDARGRLLTHSASTYQIPAISNAPQDFRVRLLEDADQPRTIGQSKAVGEPPLMLALSVREALRDAVGAETLASPATGEAIFRALHGMPPSGRDSVLPRPGGSA